MKENITICAIASPSGIGAVALIRVSGSESVSVISKIFKSSKWHEGSELLPNYTYYGRIFDNDRHLDNVLLCYFKSPLSYTGEDVIEISCHGSVYIQQEILKLLINNGASMAEPGEFTKRAFFNGKIDLSQAEAVADLISSSSKASHEVALRQVKGGFARKIEDLRKELLKFTALIELELDFSEEEVEFAKRDELKALLSDVISNVENLKDSFASGSVIKKGIPVAIVGKPNTGKSTLLNILLNDDKAIVSEIPGTTRDYIEDSVVIHGIQFRFIDTAGLRHSDDVIENLGIERTYEKINEAKAILYMFDISVSKISEITSAIDSIKSDPVNTNKHVIAVANMTDKLEEIPRNFKDLRNYNIVFISARKRENISLLVNELVAFASEVNRHDGLIVTNIRHYEALRNSHEALLRVFNGLESGLSNDFIAQDLRESLFHLGLITGNVTTDDVLKEIFSNFCIGK